MSESVSHLSYLNNGFEVLLIPSVGEGFEFFLRLIIVSFHYTKKKNTQEKAPYVAKAAKRKAEYEKIIASFDKKQVFLFFLMI